MNARRLNNYLSAAPSVTARYNRRPRHPEVLRYTLTVPVLFPHSPSYTEIGNLTHNSNSVSQNRTGLGAVEGEKHDQK